jgi:hypothetical protein
LDILKPDPEPQPFSPEPINSKLEVPFGQQTDCAPEAPPDDWDVPTETHLGKGA